MEKVTNNKLFSKKISLFIKNASILKRLRKILIATQKMVLKYMNSSQYPKRRKTSLEIIVWRRIRR
jgi:hypothetical protein